MERHVAEGEDSLVQIHQILCAWQWALAEHTCPYLGKLEPSAPVRPQAASHVERTPWDIRKLDEEMGKVRADLGRFRQLTRWHRDAGLAILPRKAKWQRLAAQYRAHTPAMWQKWANELTDHLATLRTQRRQRVSRRKYKQDSAALATGLKSHLLRQTAPEVAQMAAAEAEGQKAKAVETFRGIWSQESVESSFVEEPWFQAHSQEVRAKLGGLAVSMTMELLQEALKSISS